MMIVYRVGGIDHVLASAAGRRCISGSPPKSGARPGSRRRVYNVGSVINAITGSRHRLYGPTFQLSFPGR